MKKLTIIIVSYNVKYYLEQCLTSVVRAKHDIDMEVFVVDNHSKDDSVNYLRSRFPWVNIIESNHNLGFSRANNMAIRQSTGQYVLLLNPDTFIGERVFVEAIKFMDEHPDAGGVGGRMHNDNGTFAPESRRAVPTPMTSFLKMLGFSDRYYMSHLPWDRASEIDVISGAFFLIRREALMKIGLLDETFFMYGEDIDLSYRLQLNSYKNWFLPLDIVHYKGESTTKSSFRYVHVFYQAMLIFFRKHYGHLSFFITIPIKMAIYFKAIIALISQQYHRMRESLGFFRSRRTFLQFYFRGSIQMQNECRNLIKRKGLTEGDAEEPSNATPCCIVFDTDTYSYEDIIQEMHKISNPDIVLGTYSCKTKVLITPKEILI